jgi:ZIP family zinc transporter
MEATMTSYWTVFGLALLPALGNFAGGVLAELTQTNLTRLSNALHAAAGIIIAVVAIELMPAALRVISGFWVAAAFGLGGIAYVLIEWAVKQREEKSGSGRTGMWMIYIAVSIDLASDGLMIGTGSAVSSSMALALATGQVLADVPEGYATIINMKNKGVAKAKRLLLSASFSIPILATATIAFLLLREQSEVWQMSALSFIAGLLTLAAVEDMVSEAHESVEDTYTSMISFTAGFVLFTLVSASFN